MTRRLMLVLRLVLGAVFVYAAYTKLRQPWLVFAMSIDAYRLLPEWAVLFVARTLPWFELIIGLLLVSGYRLRLAASATAALLAGFFAVMLLSYGKGMSIDCGCFGLGEALTWKSLVRDGALASCAVLLAVLSFCRQRGPATG